MFIVEKCEIIEFRASVEAVAKRDEVKKLTEAKQYCIERLVDHLQHMTDISDDAAKLVLLLQVVISYINSIGNARS
jgi:hypothetical protein